MTHPIPQFVKEELRTGNCLQASLAELLGCNIRLIPNFHKLSRYTWRGTFESWLNHRMKMSLEEKPSCENQRCVAVYRLKHKKTGEWYPLHAVIHDQGKITFDILEGHNADLEYDHLVRAYHITPLS